MAKCWKNRKVMALVESLTTAADKLGLTVEDKKDLVAVLAGDLQHRNEGTMTELFDAVDEHRTYMDEHCPCPASRGRVMGRN